MGPDEGIRGTRIMLVEDDALLRDSLSIFFRTKGCALRAFPDAEAAIEGLGTEPLDVVISDHVLPALDGLSFLRCAEGLNPEAVRILITAYPGGGLSAETTRAGVDAFLEKPFTAEILEKAIAEQLGRRRRGAPRGTEKADGSANAEPEQEDRL